MNKEYSSANRKQIEKSFVLQQDQTDCGVACLLSLIHFYGGQNTLEELRKLSGTTQQGTTLLGLYQASNQTGFDSVGCEADLQALIVHDTPVILHVLLEENLQHYVVCYSYDKRKEKFIIGDPSTGIRECSRADLEAVWKSKSCLTLKPNKYFVKTKDKIKQKKEWFLTLLKEDFSLLRYSVGLGVIITTLGMVMAVFSQKLIDDILPSKDFNKLITGIALVAFLLIARAGFSVLREYFLIKQTKDFNNRIISSFFNSLLYLPMPFFDNRKIGELVARLNDTQRVQKVIRMIVGNIIIDVLTVITSFGFLFYYSWQTGAISSVCLPFYYFLMYRFNTRILNAQNEVMQGYAMNESNFINTMQGIATVKNNNRQRVFKKMNQLIYGNFQEKVFNLGRINLWLSFFSGVFGIVFLVLVLAYNSAQVYRGVLQLGELMAILSIAGNLLPSIANLALITIPMNEAKVAFDRMFEFASTPGENVGEIDVKVFKSLEIKNLNFRFAGRSPLLKNVDMHVELGKCVAIIGESGTGKSTLGQILQKFYEYESGGIIVNNSKYLQDIDTEDWRNIIGVVPQQITIFNGTILDNIVIGEPYSFEEVVDFCQEYGFEKFINILPQGYATIVGEEGINLSEGQKQIIGLVRALYKKPQLLILDEPTAAMDRKTEKFVIELIKKLKGTIAVFLISHRLHSLKAIVDMIYILEKGTISLKGNHLELMETTNFYSEYWKTIHEL